MTTKGLARALAMAAVSGLALTGCRTTPNVPPQLVIRATDSPARVLGEDAPRRSGARAQSAEVGTQAFATLFLEKYGASYHNPDGAFEARQLTRYGMTLIDVRCDLFFGQIGRGAQGSDFFRREFQSITAALIAALGLTTIGKDAITGVGIGSALGVQTIDNYSNVYFFSPEVASVQRLVRRTFDQQRADLLSPEGSPKDFDAAIGALRAYQNTCTAHEIKRLVTEMIDHGGEAGHFGPPDERTSYQKAADQTLTVLAPLLNAQTLDRRQAILIEALVTNEPRALSAQEVDYLCSTLTADLQAQVCKGVATKEIVDGTAVTTVIYRKADRPVPPAVEARAQAQWAALRALMGGGYAIQQDKFLAVIEANAANYAKLRQQLQLKKDLQASDVAAGKDDTAVKAEVERLTTAKSAVVAAPQAVGEAEQATSARGEAATGSPAPPK